MSFSPIIEVLVAQEGDADVHYRMHPSTLDMRQYGEIFATLVDLTAKMVAHEGNFVQAKVRAEIIHYLLNELERPTAEVTTKTGTLQ